MLFLTPNQRVVIVAADLVILREFTFTLHWRNKVDSNPVSAHVSPSGSIAIGYKRGGFAVFRGCTTNSAGDFERLSLRCASLIMQSLAFSDAKSFATTCTYFWKQLSARRRQWAIFPMQPSRFIRAQYLYMKWAHSNVGTRPWKLVDAEGRPVCKDFLAGRCTRPRCPDTHQPPDIKSLIRKYARETCRPTELVVCDSRGVCADTTLSCDWRMGWSSSSGSCTTWIFCTPCRT